MGTWDTGPWDNDGAADWGAELDEMAEGARLDAVRGALAAAADEGGEHVDSDVGEIAVAAASIVAAACPDGPSDASGYGPVNPIPGVAEHLETLRPLAVRALDRVVADDSELAELWDDAGDPAWREAVVALRTVLAGA